MGEAPEVESQHPIDVLITDLRELRVHAGDPPYSELARRITERRMADGMSEAAARTARSTVFDVFQLGRRRISPDLLGEIVLALGADDAIAQIWKQRCVTAKRLVPVVPPVPAPALVRVVEEAPAQEEKVEYPAFPVVRAPIGVLALLLLACTLLNLFGGWLVMAMRLPLYLDMVGTAIASVVLGPWWGVLVAVGTNGGETVYDGSAALPFVIVNVAGALVWGYGVRRFAMGRNVARFFTLNVLAALVCTTVAVPILLLNFHGVTRNAASSQTLSLAATYHSLLAGLWSANTLTSLVDKLICGFAALTAASALPATLTTRLPNTWGIGGAGYAQEMAWRPYWRYSPTP